MNSPEYTQKRMYHFVTNPLFSEKISKKSKNIFIRKYTVLFPRPFGAFLLYIWELEALGEAGFNAVLLEKVQDLK